MFALSAYQLPSGPNWGPIYRELLQERHIDEKSIYLGRMDKGAWSRMMTGTSGFDLNFIYAYTPTDVLISFAVRVLAEKARDVASAIQEVA
jgi:hypothetical protein